MPVSIELQSAIARQYAQLSAAVTNDPAREQSVLAAGFHDRAPIKLSTFDYNPLTILIQKIVVQGPHLEVHAQYIRPRGQTATTIDHWTKINHQWRLADRN